jgi:ArsR family transcriptional regulator
MCVCDVSAMCGLSESAASHQLRILRNLKIVRGRREGKNMLYRLDDDHVDSLIRHSIYHVQENEQRS